MKSLRINASLVLTIIMALAVFSNNFASAIDNKTITSKRELKALLKTANEPADHMKIAAYYRQEAVRLDRSAQEHAELAAIYKQSPPNPALEAKHGSAVEGASHCTRWSELSKEQAKEAEALAILHEDMAQKTGKK